eukprot:CAMPEP_0197009970 /NCGR_PEP_ID=MMETSP1380-20130617/52249_1 /TAXON_ID=5936 /ORGANISM="Euplotes crassus, Strain CT5" /LENGTH=136 /DNA_ID=CAMNT_0042431573 /DNA_START=199 /DNA_END=609 /DNA_ORIENTATION=+
MKNRDEMSQKRVRHITKVIKTNAQNKLNTIKNYKNKSVKNYSKILDIKKKSLKYTLNVMELKSLAMKVHNSRNTTPTVKSTFAKPSSHNSPQRKSVISQKEASPSFVKKTKLKDEYFTRLAHQYNEIIDSPDLFVK